MNGIEEPQSYKPTLRYPASSTYRRVPVFASKRFCLIFAQVLGRLRQEFGFRLVGC